jgi:hypothetical protein
MGHKTAYRSKLRPQPHFRGILTLTSVQLDPGWILTPVGYSQDGEASVLLIACRKVWIITAHLRPI